MSDAKKARIENARLEANERRTRALNSLALCLSRSNVMRVHHNAFIHEIEARGGLEVVWSSVAAKTRFTTYVAYWFAGLAAVIERYQELTGKDTIPTDPKLDALLTEDRLSLVKPFRNAIAHCSDFDDARVLRLLEAAETLPDWAETVAHEFRRYLMGLGVAEESASDARPTQSVATPQSAVSESQDTSTRPAVTSDELQRTIASIKTSVPGAFEVYRRYEFVGYREMRRGGTEGFRVELLDAGPSDPHIRYTVKVETEHGGRAVGNPAESIEIALMILHMEHIEPPESG